MQTFLPYADFDRSAAVLDGRRLGKQRVEALQVLRGIARPGSGWTSHPVVRMWRAHPLALAVYARAIHAAWTARGHADTCWAKSLAELAGLPGQRRAARALAAGDLPAWTPPPWLGAPPLHASHRAMLLAKDPRHYAAFGWDDALPGYVWPVPEAGGYVLRAGPPRVPTGPA